MKKLLLMFIMAGLVSLTGCNSGGLGYAMDLQESLNERYEAEEINVQIHNSELIVTLVNSPLEDLSVEEKQEMAREMGMLAMAPNERPELTSGKLVFENRADAGVASLSDSHSFDMELAESAQGEL